jgi:hypothetical protein
MGPKRSVNAVFQAERLSKEEQARTMQRANARWYAAAKRFEWESRAEIWDREQEEQRAELMRSIAAKCQYVSRPYRITQLNSMADALARTLEQGIEPALFLNISKQIQSLMHDVADEVTAWNASIDASCDAAALNEWNAKNQRLKEYAEEREVQMDFELDQKIAQAQALQTLNAERKHY